MDTANDRDHQGRAMQSRSRPAGIEATAAAERIALSVQVVANRDIGSGLPLVRSSMHQEPRLH